MALAFHGTPISPKEVLTWLDGHCFCVSFFDARDIERVSALAFRVMIDNGAFSAWKQNVILDREYWSRFYAFVLTWLPLCMPNSFFVFPDVIDAGTQEQDALLREAPAELAQFGWPVWHLDEPVSRCSRLIDQYGRVCLGSTAEYRVIGSPDWRERMDEVFNEVARTFGDIPPMHMLRGLQLFLPNFDYPISQADSTDVGRNHNRIKKKNPDRHQELTIAKAARWDLLGAKNQTEWRPDLRRPPDAL